MSGWRSGDPLMLPDADGEQYATTIDSGVFQQAFFTMHRARPEYMTALAQGQRWEMLSEGASCRLRHFDGLVPRADVLFPGELMFGVLKRRGIREMKVPRFNASGKVTYAKDGLTLGFDKEGVHVFEDGQHNHFFIYPPHLADAVHLMHQPGIESLLLVSSFDRENKLTLQAREGGLDLQCEWSGDRASQHVFIPHEALEDYLKSTMTTTA